MADATAVEETTEQSNETPVEETPKVEESPKAEAKPEQPAEAKPQAPEKYELKLQENSLLDGSQAVERIAAIGRAQGLSNEQAQSLLDTVESEALADRNARVKEWDAKLMADEELGGENLAQTQQLAIAGLDWLAPQDQFPEFRKLLDASGYGSHPVVVKAMVRLGRAIKEDTPLSGKPTGEKTPEETLKEWYSHPSSQTG